MSERTGQYDIAVTGYACRLPQAATPEAFWRVLADGRCVITEVGADRFETGLVYDPDPAAIGKSYSIAAGQIDDIWGFDPGFFSISPREAAQMDPQQRVLLQVVWEALEHAGLTGPGLDGAGTGVFVGASSSDYSAHFLTDLARVDTQFMTGNTLSIIANRISYLLDLGGPSFTVDTACSSSFYALHAACQTLMSGEIDTAIVGGVNLLVAPGPFVGFSRATMLSPSGLCRAFDAGADGYVRSEGAVVFVLRRLKAALENGEMVRSVLAGSGINSDGRTVGMSMPSSQRQADLLRSMQAQFGIAADDIAFIEAHGTGTPVGDPLEAHAIGSVFGQARQSPLPIGSAKTNVGHLEPVSGLVGLLKAQLALEKGVLPASLHVEAPNPNIDFPALGLEIATQARDLPARDTPWFAGVNSFGFGGANAHALLRQPRADERPACAPVPSVCALTLSAASADSLTVLAASMRDSLSKASEAEAARQVNAAAWRRATLQHRVVVLGTDRDTLLAGLDAFGAGEKSPLVIEGKANRTAGKTAFLFSGNGSQWAGMGHHLHATDPVFRDSFDDIAARFAKIGRVDPSALLFDGDLAERLGSSQVAQPVLFAVQMALVDALAARGLQPDAVAGHSVGEVAAATTAGIIDRADAVRLVHTRSVALDGLRGSGGMAAVSADAAQVEAALAEAGIAGVSIAGINSPRSVTVSGDAGQIKALLAWLRRNRRVAGVMLDVEIPYHSASVEPLRRRMIEDLKGLRPSASTVVYASSTTGQIAHGLTLDTDYWWRNAREVVRFEDAVDALCEAGCRTFVEVSPRPVLAAYVRDKLRVTGHAGSVARTMDQGKRADTGAAEMVAHAFTLGAGIDRRRFFGPKAAMGASLPNYPWANVAVRAQPSTAHADVWGMGDFHPLIGRAVIRGNFCWEGDVNVRSLPWLADHVVDGVPVFPAAGFAEMALAAGTRALPGVAVELTDLEIVRPLVLDRDGGVDTRVTVDPQTGAVRIEARHRLAEEGWALHAIGTVRAEASDRRLQIDAPVEDAAVETAPAALYGLLDDIGLAYGPAFRLADALRSDAARAEAVIRAENGPQDSRFALNPAHLDAAMHAVFPILMAHASAGRAEGTVFLPVRIGRLRLARPGTAVGLVRVAVTRHSPRGVDLALELLGADGSVVAVVEGLRLQATRLRGRAGHEALTWQQRLVRLREPDGRVHLPSGWRAPDNRLRALGVATVDEPDPDAGLLLVDAACRRLAWDSVAALVGPQGRLLGAANPVLARLLVALEEDGLFEPDETGGRILADCPYPTMSEIVASMTREAPERAQELMELMRLERLLPTLAADPDGLADVQPAPSGMDLSAGQRQIWQSMGRVASDLAQGWSAKERLSVLILGEAPATIVDTLCRAERACDVVVAHTEERVVERLRQTLPAAPGLQVVPLAEALRPFRFDVVLCVDLLDGLDEAGRDALSASLALSGLLVAAMTEPSLIQALRQIVRERGAAARASSRAADVETALAAGFRDITAQTLATGAVEARILTARPRHQAVRASLPVPAEGPRRLALLVLTDRREENRRIAALLEASLVTAGLDVRQCLAGDRIALEEAVSEVVHLADLPDADSDPMDTATRRIETLRDILDAPAQPERVWVVTRGGAPIDGAVESRAAPQDMPQTNDAAIWGATRVVTNEYPAIEFRQIDFPVATAPETLAENICSLIMSGTDEAEIVFDEAGFLAPRVEPGPDIEDAGQGRALQLRIGQQAVLDTLSWRPAERRDPGPGEIEIEIRATGLNFRDLMWAQGLLPDEALEDGFAGATLGMECAGIVAKAGKGSAFRRGDAVIAFAPACFSTHVTVACEAVARLPAGATLETAAAIPTIFVTAQYALATLANLRRGDVLLVHGGAGGVGLAAVQIARRLGAEVIATAGTPEKRRLLRHLGVRAVFDSRSLAFAEEVMAETAGRGVDVVLNSLAGEAMERSLSCLKPFGRFVELGKRDFYANTRLGLRPFRRNLSYFGVDADQLLRDRPDLAETLLSEVAEGFADGAYTAPPCQIFEAAEIVDAFRLMQQSRHIGKVILRPPALPAAAPTALVRKPGAPVRGAWLIVGGLGGFGLATARQLAREGAEAIWLSSRSGRTREADKTALEALRATGIPVMLRAADTTDAAATQALINEIAAGDVPLRGVVHAAMLLDDALSADLDTDRISAVMAPKIAGAYQLDRLTRELDLDHFVLFSSVTTLFGNPGQLPYVAANSYLERLAVERRAAGLPGFAIAWGPIADQGYLARDERTRTLLSRKLGARMLTAAEALAIFARLLKTPPDAAVLSVAPMRWRLLASDLKLLSTPLFHRIEMEEGGGMSDGVADLLALIDGLDDEAAAGKITEALVAETARILRQPATEIDPYQPLTELGFDSLMAMDLKLAAEEAMGVTIPILSVGDGMTLAQLATRIVGQLRGGGGRVTGDTDGDKIVSQHLGAQDAEIDDDLVRRVSERANQI
ncbi:MAG: SDR family NAD(P)-dependent oxidoreductase [Pseudomonadota bacterium]